MVITPYRSKMYGAYGQGGQQQQYGYNQQQQQPQYGAPPQQQYQYQQSQYTQQPQQTQQQSVANNVNVVQPEQQPVVVESSKPAPIYVDTQHDDMVRLISFSLNTTTNFLRTFVTTMFIILVLCYVFVLSNLLALCF